MILPVILFSNNNGELAKLEMVIKKGDGNKQANDN